MPGFDHFSWLAPLYDRLIKSRQNDPLHEILGLPVSGSIFDAGGGTGRIAQSFCGLVNQVVVGDSSFAMLKIAISKPCLAPVCSYSEALPFAADQFARIVMVDAFHHMSNQRTTAQELFRVLKPGGRLVIEEPDVRRWEVKLIAVGEKLLLMRSHFLSPPRIAELFSEFPAQITIQGIGMTGYVIADKPA